MSSLKPGQIIAGIALADRELYGGCPKVPQVPSQRVIGNFPTCGAPTKKGIHLVVTWGQMF